MQPPLGALIVPLENVGLGGAEGGAAAPRVWPHPQLHAWPPPSPCGLLAGPGPGPLLCWCSAPVWSINGLLLMFCLNAPSRLRILVHFLVLPCKTCIYQNLWKT